MVCMFGWRFKTVSLLQILNALKDEKSMLLFQNGVHRENMGIQQFYTLLQMSRKQYYSRIYELKEAGLIRRSYDGYELTSTGVVVKHLLELLEKAIKVEPKLRAYDALKDQWSDEVPSVDLAEKLFDGDNDQEILALLTEQRAKYGTMN